MTSCPKTDESKVGFFVWYVLLGTLSVIINCYILFKFIQQSSTYRSTISKRLGHRKDSDTFNLFSKSRKLSIVAIICFIITTVLETLSKTDCLMTIFNNYGVSSGVAFFKWIFLISAYIFLFLIQIYRIDATFSNSIYAVKSQILSSLTAIMIVVIVSMFIVYTITRQEFRSEDGSRSTSTQSNSIWIKYNVAYFILISIICAVSIIVSMVFANKLNQLMLSLRGSCMISPQPSPRPSARGPSVNINININTINDNTHKISPSPSPNVGVEIQRSVSSNAGVDSNNINGTNINPISDGLGVAASGNENDCKTFDVETVDAHENRKTRLKLDMSIDVASKRKGHMVQASTSVSASPRESLRVGSPSFGLGRHSKKMILKFPKNDHEITRAGSTTFKVELTERQSKLVQVVTKQVLLATFESFFFVIYMICKLIRTIVEVNMILDYSHDDDDSITRDDASSFTIDASKEEVIGYETVYFISIFLRNCATVAPVISIWLSFIFAKEEYYRICKPCHKRCLKLFVKSATNQVEKKFNSDADFTLQ